MKNTVLEHIVNHKPDLGRVEAAFKEHYHIIRLIDMGNYLNLAQK